MSNSSESYVGFWNESGGFGVPGSTPTIYKVAFSDHALGTVVQKVRDPTIRSDRNALPPITTFQTAGGTINGVLRYDSTGAFWQILRHVLQSAADTAATTPVGSVNGTGYTLTATGIHTGIEIGDVVRVKLTGTRIGYHRVTNVATGVLTIDTNAYNGLSGYTVDRGKRIKNGSTQSSYACELGYVDVSKYETLVGLTPGSFQLNVTDQQLVTWSLGFIGKNVYGSPGSSAYPGATYVDAPTGSAINCEDNVISITLNGASYPIQGMQLTVSNNLRARTGPGQVGAQSIGSGEFTVSGSIQVYFADFTEYSKFLSDSTSGIYVALEDPSGNGYVISIPTFGYESHQRPIAGLNTDVVQTLTFTGSVTVEGANSHTVRIEAFAA